MFDAFKKLIGGGKSEENGESADNPMQERAQELLSSALDCLEKGDTKTAFKYLNMSLSYAPAPRTYLEMAKYYHGLGESGQTLIEVSNYVEKGISLSSNKTDSDVVKDLKELKETIAPLLKNQKEKEEKERQASMQRLEEYQERGKGRDLATLKKEFQNLKRTAWVPATEDGDGDRNCSKFGGLPLTSEEHPWPDCSHCGKSMEHFLQLQLADLPADINLGDYGLSKLPEGWLQFYFCNEHWEDNENSFVTRIIKDAPKSVSEPKAKYSFAKKITEWNAVDDFPDYEDFSNLLEIGMSDDFDDEWVEDLYEKRLGRDKLLGWPVWDQSPEIAECAQCNTQMVYFFQTASEDNIPYLFGDSGTGHIHICPNDFQMAFTFSS